VQTDYLTVVTSQTALLQTQLEALSLDTPATARASVDLIRALGGGLGGFPRRRRADSHLPETASAKLRLIVSTAA